MKHGFYSGIMTVILIIACLTAQTVLAGEPSAKKMWYEEWDEGMYIAKKEKKPVIVDFYTDFCGNCKNMDETTFQEPEIISRIENEWVGIKFNCRKLEKSGICNGKIMGYGEISHYFKITAVPSFLFFDKDGEPVQVVVGYLDKDEFLPFLDYMKNEVYRKNIKFRDFKKSYTIK